MTIWIHSTVNRNCLQVIAPVLFLNIVNRERIQHLSCSFRSISRSDVPRESSRMITLMSVIVAFTFAITLWYSYYHKVTLSNRLRPFQRSAPTMLALVNWGGGGHLIPLQAVHFKVIRVVHFILIRPVHLKVIWTVHLKCRNHISQLS